MAIDERQRHELHERLDEVLGPDGAAILMSHLPPVGWADVATKRDVDQLASATKRDLDQLARAMKKDLTQLSAELRAEFHQELGHQLGGLRSDMLANHRQLVFAIVASQFTAVSLAFAASTL